MSSGLLETCEICGQEGFHGEAEVKTHMLLDHEENIGSCPLCDLAHVSPEELALHMNTVHQNILSPQHITESPPRSLPSKTSHTNFSDSSVPIESDDFVIASSGPDCNDDIILVADEVQEDDSMIFVNDYFSEASKGIVSNGTAGDTNMSFSNGVAIGNGVDANVMENSKGHHSSVEVESIQVDMDDAVVVEESLSNATGNSYDLFNGSAHSTVHEINDRLQDSEHSLMDHSMENVTERKMVKLTAGRTSEENHESSIHNGRKRGRKEPDVRPKNSQRQAQPPGERQVGDGQQGQERRNSQQSLETSMSESESIKSETSSPFRKLFRTLTGAKDEQANEDKKDKSGIWVDLTNDSEPDLLDDDGFMIEDAFPADEAQVLEDQPGSSTSSRYPTSTPSKPTSKMVSRKSSSSSFWKNEEKQTLLSLSKQAKNVQSPVLCPFCGLGNFDADFVNKHINEEHLEGAVGGESCESNSCAAGAASGGSDDISCTCPVCGLTGLNAEQMSLHVDRHFTEVDRSAPSTSHAAHNVHSEMEEADRKLAEQLATEEKEARRKKEEEEFKKLQEKYGADGKGNFSKQSESNSSRAVYRGQLTPLEYHQQRLELREALATGVDSGQTRTKGIIPRLVDYYCAKVHGVTYGRFCTDVDHFSSSQGDSGWGCGYRNIQMMLSALVKEPTFKQVVFNGRDDIPSIPRIQLLIEDAWSKGFDPQGKDQLNGKVHNTRKWIGATEVVAMLQALRIKCKLIDFHAPSGPNGTHPRLFAWIRDYFGKPSVFSADNAVRSNKLPLYLQHEGHSRTVIGCDVMQDKSIRILLFDPSLKSTDAQTLRRGDINGQALRPLRRTLSQMKSKQYQIVAIDGLMTSEREYQRSKILTSQRIPCS